MSDTVTLVPESCINQDECPRFAEAIENALDRGARDLVVDCRTVRYMNSRAIGILLETYMRMNERGGRIRIVGPDRVLRRGFEVVGLLSLIDVVDTPEDLAKGNGGGS